MGAAGGKRAARAHHSGRGISLGPPQKRAAPNAENAACPASASAHRAASAAAPRAHSGGAPRRRSVS